MRTWDKKIQKHKKKTRWDEKSKTIRWCPALPPHQHPNINQPPPPSPNPYSIAIAVQWHGFPGINETI